MAVFQFLHSQRHHLKFLNTTGNGKALAAARLAARLSAHLRSAMPTSALLLLVLGCWTAAAARSPKLASREDMLEHASEWLYQCDEDDDGYVSLLEMHCIIQDMMSKTANPDMQKARLTPAHMMPMADSNGDNKADRNELADMLLRMKNFDAGYADRESAVKPGATAAGKEHGYGGSHLERMRTKAAKKANVKDEA